MTPLPDTDAAVGHSFGLELDGVLVSTVLEVFGLTLQRDVVEMKETGPDGTYHVRRLPGHPSPGEVVLTRTMTRDAAFQTWVQGASLGLEPGSAATVVVLDDSGSVLRRYTLVNAWPSKLEVGTLATGGAEVVVESLTLEHEGIDPG